MADWTDLTVPPFISTFSKYSAAHDIANTAGSTYTVGAISWTTGTTYYHPISIPFPYLIRRFFWINNTGLGNASIGLYLPGGKAIYTSGVVAQSGATQPQFVTPSVPVQISAGRYLLAWSNNAFSARAYGITPSVEDSRWAGVMQETVDPCPATATFAANTGAKYQYCGFTNTPSGF